MATGPMERGRWLGARRDRRRAGIPLALVAIYGAICLSFEIVESLDRSSRFSPRAHWSIATFIVLGAVMAEYAKYH